MKIAILLSGQPRFTGDFTTLLNNLVGYDHADWFCYMTNNNNVIKDVISTGVYIPDCWKNYTVEWAIDKLRSNLPANNYVQTFEISDSDSLPPFQFTSTNPTNIRSSHCKQLYNIYRANQLRLDYQSRTDVKYDMVLRVRPDGSLHDLLDLNTIDLEQLKHSIFLPNNYWAAHHQNHTLQMCDQFAIASSDNMNVYANLYNDFQECINNLNSQSLDYHPEICLLMQLNRHNISTIRSSFNIGLRIFPPDLEKWG